MKAKRFIAREAMEGLKEDDEIEGTKDRDGENED